MTKLTNNELAIKLAKKAGFTRKSIIRLKKEISTKELTDAQMKFFENNILSKYVVESYNFHSILKNIEDVEFRKEKKLVLGLDRHAHAPEMNRLVYLDGKEISTPSMITVDDAIKFVIKKRLHKLFKKGELK